LVESGKERKRELMMMKMICDAKARIWGCESHACTIGYEPMSDRYYAETELDRRRLTVKNYERVLNDMFYDYCVEHASEVGWS